MANRTLAAIAAEIRTDWKSPWFGAVPYLDAMATLTSINDNYFLDSGESIVLYFLGNAKTWRGATARRIKAELKALLKAKDSSRLLAEMRTNDVHGVLPKGN